MKTRNLQFRACRGEELRPHLGALGRLRIAVFREFPYLYDGDLGYEMRYLDRYVRSARSYTGLAFDDGGLIGATTAIALEDEQDEFQGPLMAHGFDPAQTVYFGESILLPGYRGLGIGKRFMQDRIDFARSLPGRRWAAFCSVVRPPDHPLRPENYVPLDNFWRKQGFEPLNGVVAEFQWKEIGENRESKKQLQFWLRPLNREGE